MKKIINFMIHKLSTGFGKDVFITTCGQIVIVFITFLNNKIISSRFGPATYTEYSLIHKTASVVAYIMILSMGIVLPKYLSIYREQGKKEKEKYCYISALLMVGITSIVITIFCVCQRKVFSNVVFGDVFYVRDVFPTMLLAVEMAVTTLLYAYYRGVDKFFKYSVSQIIVASIGAIIIILSYNMITMVYLRSILLSGIATALLIYILKQYLKEGDVLVSEVKTEAKKLLIAGGPRIPGEVILFSFTTVPLILINSKIGLEEAAAYSISFGILSAASPLFRYIGLALLPYASREISKGNIQGINRKLWYLGLLYFAISIIGIIAVLLIPELFIRILYSNEYVKFAPIVRIIVFSLLPNSMYMLLRNPIDAASDFPINTLNLGLAFIVMCGGIFLSQTSEEFAWSIFGGYAVLGIVSIISWIVLERKERSVRAQ